MFMNSFTNKEIKNSIFLNSHKDVNKVNDIKVIDYNSQISSFSLYENGHLINYISENDINYNPQLLKRSNISLIESFIDKKLNKKNRFKIIDIREIAIQK